MYADTNRKSLDPDNTHFSQVLFHQGCPLLASDLNEHGAAFNYYLRQFITDFVGKRWKTNGSFEISIENGNLKISKGHFYIHGILCVNEYDCLYAPQDKLSGQPLFPTPEWADLNNKFPDTCAVYLECWERHVNSIQKPVIKEIALGGIETASRLEIVWQVRVLTLDLAKNLLANNGPLKNNQKLLDNFENVLNETKKDSPCKDVQNLLDVFDSADPKLRVHYAKETENSFDSCSMAPDSNYRGLENQLYRVEIHHSGVVESNKHPSFKWSRENGSVVFRILNVSEYAKENEFTVDLETIGPDNRYGLCVNNWVELTSDEIEFGQKELSLAKIMSIDPMLGRLTLRTNTKENFLDCNLLRRWDQKDLNTNPTGTIDIRESNDNKYDTWIPLEYGIVIQFDLSRIYHKGDYWVFSARTTIEWPTKISNGENVPDSRPKDGIKIFRAALGVIVNGAVKNNCGCIVNPICKE